MPTRTFIGLVFLVAALFVASVPALLDPTARGVEWVGAKTGLLPEPHEPRKTKPDEDPATGAGTPADPRLVLRGRDVEDDGDLRDTLEPAERDANRRARLESGAPRLLLPGQQAHDSTPPAATAEDGVLLDVTGCPQFRPGTDARALLAVPQTQALYQAKVAQSDDPAACAATLRERVAEATPERATGIPGASARDRAAIRRGSRGAMVVAFSEIELLAQFMDDDELLDALAALDE